MKLLFELSTPDWARQFGVTDNGLGILQSASTYASRAEQEAYIRKNSKALETAGLLNALSHAHDKGLL